MKTYRLTYEATLDIVVEDNESEDEAIAIADYMISHNEVVPSLVEVEELDGQD